MHTCPPPTGTLAEYLDANGTIRGNYGHLLLELKKAIDDNLIDGLRSYFESAHLDAREHFHEQIGLSLHPDAGAGVVPAVYPNCLPPKAHRGLFGEVVAGLTTEAYRDAYVGKHSWKVPIFLFRHHDDVERYLWTLNFDPERRREIYGRHGSDFIGIALNAQGEVVRIIVGEAKWRSQLTQSVANNLLLGEKETDEATGESAHNGRGIWFGLNRDTPLPHGLRQLQRLLELRDPDGHASAIFSIDQAVLGTVPAPPRTNLVLLIGNAGKTRKPLDVLVDWEQLPKEYTAPHDLQVVEVILEKGDTLIDGLYTSLWQGE